MRRIVLLALAGIAAVFVVSGAARPSGSGQARWVITVVRPPGGVAGLATNNRGDVVWWDQYAPQFSMGYIWRGGRTTKLGTDYANVRGLNDKGQVVGWSDASAGGGFLWENGKFTSLAAGLRRNIIATAINESGQVVGVVEGTGAGSFQHAFVWQNGKLRDLGAFRGSRAGADAINDQGVIAGSTSSKTEGERLFVWQSGKATLVRPPGSSRTSTNIVSVSSVGQDGQVFGSAHGPFLWQAGRMIDLNSVGGKTMSARAMNARGQIVGTIALGDRQHAVVWKDGRLTDLGTLGGKSSEAMGVSDRGQVVGTSDTRGGASHAFIWENGKMTDLGTPAHETVSTASGISSDGHVVVGQSRNRIVLWTLRSG